MNKWYYGKYSPKGPVECTPRPLGVWYEMLSGEITVPLMRARGDLSPYSATFHADEVCTKREAFLKYEADLRGQELTMHREHRKDVVVLEDKLAYAWREIHSTNNKE